MSLQSRPERTITALAVAVSFAFALVNIGSAAAPLRPVAVSGWADAKLAIATNDIVWDATRSVILASVASSVVGYGNELVEIDPSTGAIGRQVPVGASPGRVAVSDDGSTAYVGLQVAGSVVRIDLRSFTVVSAFTSGLPTTSGLAIPRDIAVVPGDANAVAVTWQYRCCGKRFAGLGTYDNGSLRSSYNVSPGPVVDSITFSGPSRLYGFNNENNNFDFTTWDVDGIGVHLYRATPGLITNLGTTIKYSNQRLMTSYGAVIDPVQRNLMGTYSGSSDAVATSFVTNRVYYVTAGVLEEYRADNYFEVDSLALSASGRATGLIITTAGLAAQFSNGELHLLGVGVTGTGGSSSGGGGSPLTNHVQGWVALKLRFISNGIAYDPTRIRTIVATAANSPTNPSSLVEFDAQNGARLRTLALGYEPNLIAISDDSSVLYVSARLSAKIERIDLARFTVNQSFSLGIGPLGSYTGGAIAVAPGAPTTIAVVRSIVGAISRNGAGLVLFDNGQERSTPLLDPQPFDSIAFRGSGTLISATRAGTTQPLRVLSLDSYGAHIAQTGDYLGGSDLASVMGSVALLRCGALIDTSTFDILGSVQATGCLATADVANDRVYDYDAGSSSLAEWQLSSYRQVARRTLSIGASVALEAIPMTIGIALRTTVNTVFIVPTPPDSNLSANAVSQGEGDSGLRPLNITVSLDRVSPLDLTLDWTTTTTGTATAGTDFVAASGTLQFPAGSTSAVISVDIIGDLVNEQDETMVVALSNPSLGAALTPASKLLVNTIQNDDARPTILPWMGYAAEGNSGTTMLDIPLFLVSPDYAQPSPSGQPITVTFQTVDASATAGADYVATSGTITIPPGQSTAYIHVPVIGDTLKEGDEVFLVALTSSTNADIGGYLGLAIGAIADDD